MVSDDWYKVVGNISKIGNSYSVRIPMRVVKQITAEEGSLVVLKIKKAELTIDNEKIAHIVEATKQCTELEAFSDDKIWLMSRLMYNEGRYIIEKLGKGFKTDMTALGPEELKAYENTSIAILNEYRDSLKSQFGDKMLEDYLLFRKSMDTLIATKRADKASAD